MRNKERILPPAQRCGKEAEAVSMDAHKETDGHGKLRPQNPRFVFPQPRQRFFHPRQSAEIECPAALKMIHSGFCLHFPEPSPIPPSAKTAGKPMAERRHQFPGGTLPRSHADGRFRRGMARFAVLRIGRGSPEPGSLCLRAYPVIRRAQIAPSDFSSGKADFPQESFVDWGGSGAA